MDFIFEMRTDIGIKKSTNQDSLCVKKARTDKGEVLMAVMCDGMGGLEKGEVASACVVKSFSKWFDTFLPTVIGTSDCFGEIKNSWTRLIKELNNDIADYGKKFGVNLGTTLTAFLILEDGKYIIGHVGDSRAYHIGNDFLKILTKDQTLVAHEVSIGKLTEEEAKHDPRRNILLQCIGASRFVEPDFVQGQAGIGQCYMLCSDGFRHVIEDSEFIEAFAPSANADKTRMMKNIVDILEKNKSRGESDNISVILLKTV